MSVVTFALQPRHELTAFFEGALELLEPLGHCESLFAALLDVIAHGLRDGILAGRYCMLEISTIVVRKEVGTVSRAFSAIVDVQYGIELLPVLECGRLCC